MSLSPFPWTGLGRKERKKLHWQPQSRTERERGSRGFDTEHTGRGKGTRKRSRRKRGKAERRQDALRKKEP